MAADKAFLMAVIRYPTPGCPTLQAPARPPALASGISRVQVNHLFRELVLKDKVRWSRAEMRKYRL